MINTTLLFIPYISSEWILKKYNLDNLIVNPNLK